MYCRCYKFCSRCADNSSNCDLSAVYKIHVSSSSSSLLSSLLCVIHKYTNTQTHKHKHKHEHTQTQTHDAHCIQYTKQVTSGSMGILLFSSFVIFLIYLFLHFLNNQMWAARWYERYRNRCHWTSLQIVADSSLSDDTNSCENTCGTKQVLSLSI